MLKKHRTALIFYMQIEHTQHGYKDREGRCGVTQREFGRRVRGEKRFAAPRK